MKTIDHSGTEGYNTGMYDLKPVSASSTYAYATAKPELDCVECLPELS